MLQAAPNGPTSCQCGFKRLSNDIGAKAPQFIGFGQPRQDGHCRDRASSRLSVSAHSKKPQGTALRRKQLERTANQERRNAHSAAALECYLVFPEPTPLHRHLGAKRSGSSQTSESAFALFLSPNRRLDRKYSGCNFFASTLFVPFGAERGGAVYSGDPSPFVWLRRLLLLGPTSDETCS